MFYFCELYLSRIFVYKFSILMSEEDAKLFAHFETKLRYLLHLHTKLTEENAQLKQRLTELEGSLMEQQVEYQQLNKEYTDLKSGLVMSLDGGDIQATRKRLAKLVREVDRCIALINV